MKMEVDLKMELEELDYLEEEDFRGSSEELERSSSDCAHNHTEEDNDSSATASAVKPLMAGWSVREHHLFIEALRK